MVVDWPRIINGDGPREEVTVTTTVFAELLLPHPAAKHAAAITAAMQLKIVRNFIPPPPKQTRTADTCVRSVALTLPTFSNLAVAAIRKSG
jgi:hypothetical protein